MTNCDNLLLVMFCKSYIDMVVLGCYLMKIIEGKDCKYYSVLLFVIMAVCYTDVY